MGPMDGQGLLAHEHGWSVLSPHGLILFILCMHPDATLRDLSQAVGLTERTLHDVIKDLANAEMIYVARRGRQNVYRVNAEARFIHPLFAHIRLGTFLDVLDPKAAPV